MVTAKQWRDEDRRIRREQEAARVKPEWGVGGSEHVPAR